MTTENKAKEIFKKISNLITFTDQPIRRKFLLFSTGALFWLIVIAAIGLISLVEMNTKSRRMADVIVPQEKVSNIMLRKLRGASVSAHKIAIYKDLEVINDNYIKGKGRIDDCKNYFDILLSGGKIVDVSRGTGQFYNEFYVSPVTDAAKRKFIEEMMVRLKELEVVFNELATSKLSGTYKEDVLLDKLAKYDQNTRNIVVILNEYAISVDSEWKKFTNLIKTRLFISIILMSGAFTVAVILSGVFSILISRSLSRPISALITQIKNLSAGEIDLTRKLDVASKDELGSLSNEFNKLMDTIAHVASFKKIIEEDETVEDIYMRLGRIFIDDLSLDNCVIYEVSGSKNNMKIVYPPDAEGTELHCKRDIQIDSEMCRVKRTGHIVSSADYPNICKYYLEGTDNIHVCIPIIVGGNVGGIVQFICGKRGVCNIADVEKKISRAKQYIREAQPVLEAKRLMKTLKESAIKDMLTGLYNRRFLEESSESLCAGVIRRGSMLGLMMLDIDYFKHTNDTFGHDAGDLVLKEVAKIIKNTVRGSDLVVRFGGEEFLVVLLDIRLNDTAEVAEKIRQNVEEMKVKIAGGIIQKTISIGVSEFPADTQHFWEAIKYADIALYKAKEGGRNRVVRFTPDMWSEEKY